MNTTKPEQHCFLIRLILVLLVKVFNCLFTCAMHFMRFSTQSVKRGWSSSLCQSCVFRLQSLKQGSKTLEMVIQVQSQSQRVQQPQSPSWNPACKVMLPSGKDDILQKCETAILLRQLVSYIFSATYSTQIDSMILLKSKQPSKLSLLW